jgi:hypothetical protein
VSKNMAYRLRFSIEALEHRNVPRHLQVG